MKYLSLRIFFTLLSYIIPTKKGLYVFGCWYGEKYSDNSRALYEYLIKNKLKHPVWFTKNKSVHNHLSKKSQSVVLNINLRSLWVHIRAEAVFCNCSQNSDLIGFALNRKTIVFNLWHGTPMKLIGKDALAAGLNTNNLGMSRRNGLIEYLNNSFPKACLNFFKCKIFYLASSDTVANIISKAMGLELSQIIICGYPKLDQCYKEIDKNKDNKVLYAPTYRGGYNSEIDLLSKYGFSLEKVNHFFSERGIQLFVRLHPANRLPDNIEKEINNSKSVFIDYNDDVYDTLNECGILITDFSSIYFDGLALEKKIILAPFGFSSYLKEDRNLYFKIDDIFPLPTPKNWNELMEQWDSLTLRESNKFRDIRKKFYPHAQEPCSRALLDIIEKKIGS